MADSAVVVAVFHDSTVSCPTSNHLQRFCYGMSRFMQAKYSAYQLLAHGAAVTNWMFVGSSLRLAPLKHVPNLAVQVKAYGVCALVVGYSKTWGRLIECQDLFGKFANFMLQKIWNHGIF